MSVTVTDSQLLQGIGGGLLIAFASSLNFVAKGRITGISGAVNAIVKRDETGGLLWKESFISGLLVTPMVARVLMGNSNRTVIAGVPVTVYDDPNAVEMNTTILLLGGALVGIGTKMGSGCTSGHGACGLPRLSLRSWVATLTFCATGILTATLGLSANIPDLGIPSLPSGFDTNLALSPLVACWSYRVAHNENSILDSMFSFFTGTLFGTGLLLSGMCRPSKVLGFLTFTPEKFDVQLMLVLGTAVLFNMITFNWASTRKNPLLESKWSLPTAKDVDSKLLVGAALFGIGWGLCGICPGPGIMNALNSNTVPLWVASMLGGQLACDFFASFFTPTAVTKKD